MNTSTDHLPSALEHFDRIAERIKGRHFILCLDYDGTLTPIVQNHKDAIITGEMREKVHGISEKIPVAIISGRDISFIKEHVGLPEAYYAGSHGFEIIGPAGFHHELEEAERTMPIMDRVQQELSEAFPRSTGVELERKKFALAVHFRNADEAMVPLVRAKVAQVLDRYRELRSGKGKMVIELKPALDWHKGRALEVIVQQLDPKGEAVVAYIGDDVTDEDAFRAIGKGFGILVGAHEEPTSADHGLKDVAEVGEFLGRLKDLF